MWSKNILFFILLWRVNSSSIQYLFVDFSRPSFPCFSSLLSSPRSGTAPIRSESDSGECIYNGTTLLLITPRRHCTQLARYIQCCMTLNFGLYSHAVRSKAHNRCCKPSLFESMLPVCTALLPIKFEHIRH
ncbi:hypothetical protein K491DRAFT_406829 [Lophiostoma macrostomum CBS 122681]|uniref:Secreted protein n=1 Tax=Lophiostoma macrostomum CBS 122681 TaxID=1314788 RepID=A0A6A6TAC1_9PLEO|nr:hypothetical protein K491DRAFT_406829 [Lophiostoma macrostomum CBS 122681]